MGRGIAYVSALGGFETTLIDINEQQLASAKKEIEIIFDKSIKYNKITEQQKAQGLANLSYTASYEQGLKEANLVIEAVPEKAEIKKAVFESMEQYAPADCLFATNTSTMSPTEIASYAKRSEKTIAMHFFNPVHKMKLIEVVRGLETSDETAEAIKKVSEQMGKEPVVIHEFPGFVTSRISVLVGNEAFYMLQEGLGTPEDIDKAIKLGLNYPMGPFELVDLVGLDARLNNLRYLHEKLGEKYRPAPLLEQYVKAGRLGKKSGKGIYEYDEDGGMIKR